MVQRPAYTRLREWVRDYGARGTEDRRAVQDYIEAENRETIATFRAELYAITCSNYDPQVLEQIVSGQRKFRHGSFENWAKLMLQWMAKA